ncbi:MAG: hypothetical protein IKW81_05180, partial [Pseudobutyrivibrio sp.]|nr:hypothetical protein [Pseudobutyrivibrio sp.]
DDDDDDKSSNTNARQYIAQLVYYYFKVDEDTGEKFWSEMHSTTAVTLNPGDAYAFARPKPFNKYDHFFIEVVLTDDGEATVRNDRGNALDYAYGFELAGSTYRDSGIHTVQALFYVNENDGKRAVGLSTVPVKEEESQYTNDMGLERTGYVDGSTLVFDPPRVDGKDVHYILIFR